jgi:hypothetical protein
MLVPLVGTAIFLAPAAAADPGPNPPQPGAGPADVIIGEIEALGYEVAINRTNGRYSSPTLAQCPVTAFHNPERSGGAVQPGSTVYVDVICPEGSED